MKNILQNKKVITILLFSFLLVLSPTISYAATDGFAGIPCDGVTVKCDFNTLMQLVSNIINFLVLLAVPLAVISFSWAGFKILIAGDNVGKRKEGIKQMWKVAQGFFVLLAAWLIVKTVLNVLLNPTYFNNLPIKF